MDHKPCRILRYARLTRSKAVFPSFTMENTEQLELKRWLSVLYKSMGMEYPKFYKMDPLCKAGTLAAEGVMRALSLHADEVKSDWSVVCFNQASSLDDDRTYQETIRDAESYFPSPAVFVYTLANIVAGEIAIRHKILGETSFYITETFQPQTVAQAATDVLTLTPAHFLLGGWIDVDGENCDVLLFAAAPSDDDEMMVMTAENLELLYKI